MLHLVRASARPALSFLLLSIAALLALGAAPAQSSRDSERLARALKPRDFEVAGQKAESLLVVHYHRPSGDYTGWNLWCWPEGGEGSAFGFDREDSFGRTAIIPFVNTPPRVGFIVRRGNWEEKDFDQDRFVTPAKGKVTEIWVKSGDGAFTEDPAKIDLSLRIEGAFLDGADLATLAFSRPLSAKERKSLGFGSTIDPRLNPRVREIDEAGTVDGKRIYRVRFAKPVGEQDIATLMVGFGREAFEGSAPPQPAVVYARGVLETPEFSPTDTRFGAFCTTESTRFATWSPVSQSVDLVLFDPTSGASTRTIALKRGDKGVWETTVAGDLHGTPYRYIFRNYHESREVPDMWGFAANADSSRTVVVDLARLEPDGFASTPAPTIARPTDEILYETHVRDYSQRDDRCPADARGTYLGLVHPAPATDTAPSSGIDHLKDLGITAVHLLPVHDFTAKVGEYNWGYWTTLFNVPESNYATDPNDPTSAIRDLRSAVTAYHRAGIRVILDVVYNHTSDAGPNSPFNAPVPYYFFRTTAAGRLTNDSGTGNGFADERPMARKYIVDSVEHWLRAYKVDGFRFDLLGCHRPETVRAICERVKAIRPDATLYGEPWTGGGTTYFGKGAQKGLPIAVFNDHLRNAIRGDLDGATIGFATGAGGDSGAIRRGVAGAIDDFTLEPTETVNYASAHDNLILWDKIAKTQPAATDATRRAMQKLALGIVLTSQGIPFIHGGCDFARTKQGNHNSYNAGDDINDFGWRRKAEYSDIHAFTAGLVRLRREHPAFRMADDADVRRALRFSEGSRTVAFTLDGRAAGDPWARIFVAYNDEPDPLRLELPSGDWNVVVDAQRAGTTTISVARGSIVLPAYSMLVAHTGP
ncbi:MAG: type I pullulanase [Phycisphaerales bacterium]